MNTSVFHPPLLQLFRISLLGLISFFVTTNARAGITATLKESPFHVLIIGNEKYSTPIPGPIREARAVGKSFQKSGAATVEVVTDAGMEAMQKHLAEFAKKGKSGGTAVFYFAGSGFRHEKRDLLLAAEIGGKAELPVALDVADIRSQLWRGGFSHIILILDVCRNEPADRAFTWNVPHGVEPVPPGATITTFWSASAGEFAFSKKDDLSPFCTAFLSAVAKGRRPMFEIAWEVMRELTTVEPKGNQHPWFESNASQPLYLGWELQDASKPADSKEIAPKR